MDAYAIPYIESNRLRCGDPDAFLRSKRALPGLVSMAWVLS
jgi:hypothetical protein